MVLGGFPPWKMRILFCFVSSAFIPRTCPSYFQHPPSVINHLKILISSVLVFSELRLSKRCSQRAVSKLLPCTTFSLPCPDCLVFSFAWFSLSVINPNLPPSPFSLLSQLLLSCVRPSGFLGVPWVHQLQQVLFQTHLPERPFPALTDLPLTLDWLPGMPVDHDHSVTSYPGGCLCLSPVACVPWVSLFGLLPHSLVTHIPW